VAGERQLAGSGTAAAAGRLGGASLAAAVRARPSAPLQRQRSVDERCAAAVGAAHTAPRPPRPRAWRSSDSLPSLIDSSSGADDDDDGNDDDDDDDDGGPPELLDSSSSDASVAERAQARAARRTAHQGRLQPGFLTRGSAATAAAGSSGTSNAAAAARRSGATAAAGGDGGQEDGGDASGSSCWETASDAEAAALEAAAGGTAPRLPAARRAAAHTDASACSCPLCDLECEDDRDDDYGSEYDEDEREWGDEWEDEDGWGDEDADEECGCPSCTMLRMTQSLVGGVASGSGSGPALFGASSSGARAGAASAATSSSGGVFTSQPPSGGHVQASAAQRPGGGSSRSAFGRARSNAFVVPSSVGGGAASSMAGAAGAGDAAAAAAAAPRGLPALPRRGGGKPGAAPATPPAVPPHLLAPDVATDRVQRLAQLMRDQPFTQQLLQALPGVDPAHASVAASVRLLKVGAYTPALCAVSAPKSAPAGSASSEVSPHYVSFSDKVAADNGAAARQLLARWQWP
jgi:hypothetical protein